MSKRALTNWIPIDKNISQKQEVLLIAVETGMNQWEVVGRLVEFWSFLDSNFTSENVRNLSVKKRTFVPLLSTWCPQNFLEALLKAGWVVDDGDSYLIPNAHRYLGESTKKRLKDAERKRIERKSDPECPKPVQDMSEKKRTKSGPEKEKEKEKDITCKSKSTLFAEAPSLEESFQYGDMHGIPRKLIESWYAKNELSQWEVLEKGAPWNMVLSAYWKAIPPKAQQEWKNKPQSGKRRSADRTNRPDKPQFE